MNKPSLSLHLLPLSFSPSSRSFSPMAITVFDACKRRKRTPKIFSIHDFATPPGSFMDLSGPFRDNVRLFLQNCGEKEDYNVAGNPVWCTLLVSEGNGIVFPLYTIEEDVKSSSRPLCDFCRCVGWGHHYVSKRRYHLIIPKDDKWQKPLTRESLELTSHLLHGVIHCNGFGHLLCINGIVSGSNYLSGNEIMDVWDRLCATLQTRKISLDDVSRKRSMELRLLHGVAYGRPWFGKWGYRFSHGSFGITEDKYKRAIQILSSLELDKITHDLMETNQGKVVQQVIHCYSEASEAHLVTLSDLLQFMLAFKSKAPIERKTAMALIAISLDSSTEAISNDQEIDVSCYNSLTEEDLDSRYASLRTDSETTLQNQSAVDKKSLECNSFASFAKRFGSRYPARRLEEAAKVVFNVLEERKSTISRQELRDAVRMHIGDTGLIDFLLKHINKINMGAQVVHKCINPVSKVLEFSLQNAPKREEEAKKIRKPPQTGDWSSIKPGLNVYEDIFSLYQSVLLGYPETDMLTWATEVILDSKNFVKEFHSFKGNKDQNKYLRISYQVIPNYDELVTSLTRPLPLGDLVTVPQNATVGELKLAAQNALRDTYCIMESFEVMEIRDSELVKKKEQEVITCERNEEIVVLVRGFGLDLGTQLRYEGGFDNWRVDCKCGAKDDDGERMVACDSCTVWQHTRCNYIEDDDDVPCVFLCSKCIDTEVKNKKRELEKGNFSPCRNEKSNRLRQRM